MRLPERKRPPVRAGADLSWRVDQLKVYRPVEQLAIPPMIAKHIGVAYLAALAAGGDA